MDEVQTKGRKFTWLPKFKKWGYRDRVNFKIGMLFLLPWTIGFLAFTLYPMVASLVYSFSIYHPRAPLEWNGIKNYTDLLTDDTVLEIAFQHPVHGHHRRSADITRILFLRCFAKSESKRTILLPGHLFSAIHCPDRCQYDPLVVDIESTARNPEHFAGLCGH